jgi:hypothetical protein
MGINLALPIFVKVDNDGAIYLSNNYSLGQRTKHINIRRHFVREFVQDGLLKTIFVPTDEKESDISTKNTQEDTFTRHRDRNLDDITLVLIKKPTI